MQVVDIRSSNISSTQKFTEGNIINDIIAIDDSHYLLAGINGLLKTTKDQMINHYHKGKTVFSLCHLTGSIYLIGFKDDGLIVWDEDQD